MGIEDFLAAIPRSYWNNPIKTVHSSGNSGFIRTVYLAKVTIVELPCCISLMALVGPDRHRQSCEALEAVRSWKGGWF